MAKASTSGKAKTRLSPPLTPDEAAEFNTAFLRDIANNLLAAASRASIRGMMAFGPPGSEDFFTATMPRDIDLFECWLPHFGDCLLYAISAVLSRGSAAAVVLNADSPTLPAAYLVETAEVLARPGDRAALGPSSDGGYYLLGLKKPHRRLFEDIAWSTEYVAEQTIDRAREIGLPVHLLPTWYDIDDRQSLSILHDELFAGRPFEPSVQASPAHHTRALMQRLLAEADLAGRLGLVARSLPPPPEDRSGAQPQPFPVIGVLR
jgi:rSAM/selenodomain-associated transferase 1